MLALYAGQRDERKLDISAVCFAVPAPTTTVLRRIDRLQGLGLIDRVPDKTDGRRTFVVLQPVALGQTEACLHALAQTQPCDADLRT